MLGTRAEVASKAAPDAEQAEEVDITVVVQVPVTDINAVVTFGSPLDDLVHAPAGLYNTIGPRAVYRGHF